MATMTGDPWDEVVASDLKVDVQSHGVSPISYSCTVRITHLPLELERRVRRGAVADTGEGRCLGAAEVPHSEGAADVAIERRDPIEADVHRPDSDVVAARHVPFDPRPWASMDSKDSALLRIATEHELAGWQLVRVVPVNDTESMAVFERRS